MRDVRVTDLALPETMQKRGGCLIVFVRMIDRPWYTFGRVLLVMSTRLLLASEVLLNEVILSAVAPRWADWG